MGGGGGQGMGGGGQGMGGGGGSGHGWGGSGHGGGRNCPDLGEQNASCRITLPCKIGTTPLQWAHGTTNIAPTGSGIRQTPAPGSQPDD